KLVFPRWWTIRTATDRLLQLSSPRGFLPGADPHRLTIPLGPRAFPRRLYALLCDRVRTLRLPAGRNAPQGGFVWLSYIAVSSMFEPEAMEYPDSGKVTLRAGSPPDGDKAARLVSTRWRTADTVDYWTGGDAGKADP